ncbi:hypothetical protein TNIN_244491 [Trichonephila inaurata madagascariensis]|uniref:Uncharacterized protein n=1 Tax=Trichonephila inaurata madagascariensis TaxID=2747483 RepID=A0A8X7BNH5_9ARAC|nr:hypothetical protein TNIN_244491 [Trichonephila inaurata madagascariensis]
MPRKRVMGGTEILGTSLHDNVIDPEIRDSSFTGFSDEFRRLELENLLEKRTSGVRKKEGVGVEGIFCVANPRTRTTRVLFLNIQEVSPSA